MSRLHLDACRCLWIVPSEIKRPCCDVLSIIVALTSAYASVSAALFVGLCVYLCVPRCVGSSYVSVRAGGCACSWIIYCMYFWVSRWMMEDVMHHKRSPQTRNSWQLIGHSYVAYHWNQLNISSTRQSRSTVSSVLAPQCQPPVIKSQDVASLPSLICKFEKLCIMAKHSLLDIVDHDFQQCPHGSHCGLANGQPNKTKDKKAISF